MLTQILLATLAHAASPTTYVGILGFASDKFATETTRTYFDPCLYPAFEANGGVWRPIPFRPENGYEPLPTTKWFAFFNGKAGEALNLKRRRPERNSGAPDHDLNCLNPGENENTVRLLRQRNDLRLNLLATTNGAAVDRAAWTRTTPTDSVAARAKAAFLARFGMARVCRVDPKDPPWGTIEVTKTKLAPSALAIDARAFKSKRGETLVGVSVSGPTCVIDTHVSDPYYQKHWFVVSASDAREVGPEDRDNSLEPIEVADFDGDGKTEWVFRQNSVNAGGVGSTFILYDDRFKEVARASVGLKATED